MRVPFRAELDEVFRSDRSVWLKIGGCAFVTMMFVFLMAIRVIRDSGSTIAMTPSLIAGLAILSGGVGVMLGLALSLKDVVDRRIDRRASVNPILFLYFGRRQFSLFVWFITIIVLSFVVLLGGIKLKFF